MGCDAAGGKPSGGNAHKLGFMIKNKATSAQKSIFLG
jgi:hypothetical protein